MRASEWKQNQTAQNTFLCTKRPWSMVEYSPGFRSDHWCARGHVLLVLEGELIIELKDGQIFHMPPGTSFQAADDDVNPHLAFTDKGAKVFIVD
jgi:quercetin dioxygenase-like cupin family protein